LSPAQHRLPKKGVVIWIFQKPDDLNRSKKEESMPYVNHLNLPEFLKPVFEIIAFILFWLFVPGIMLGIVILGKRLARKVSDSEMKTSARAGWWAGMVLFVFFFIY
jgi:hypothetical protein